MFLDFVPTINIWEQHFALKLLWDVSLSLNIKPDSSNNKLI